MKRSLSICLLSVSLGMPAVSVGAAAAVVCVTHSPEWQKFKAKITKHQVLDHKPSPATIRKWTAYNKAMLAKLDKQLEVMCGEVGSISGDGFRDGDVGFVSRSDGGSSFLGFSGDLEGDSEGQLIALVAAVDYPTYDNPSRALPEAPGYPGFGGWYGSAGYIGGGGNSVPPPVVPIAPTPEPSTLALTFAPLLFLAIRRLKKTAQLRLEEYAA